VWRFDVTSQNPANWAVSPSGYLFSTGGQPITTKPVVAAAPAIGGQLAVIVSFGTGRKIPQTLTASTQYASGTEDLYGIWDWNMSGWNSKSAYHYAALSGVPTAAAYGGTFPIITTSNLQQQTITDFSTTDSSGNPLNYATLSNNAVCWYGSSTCSSGNTQFGWYMALPNLNEQIVYNPTLQLGAFIVNSLIPAVASPLTCQSSNPSGYTYAINPVTGAGAGSTTTSSNGSSSGASGGSGSQTSFFGNPAGTINPVTGVTVAVSGQQLNASGTVSVLTAPGSSSTSGSTNLVYQTYSGTPAASQVNPGGNVTATRLTWKEIR
jgi:type IV pilus assembly protein PilY1